MGSRGGSFLVIFYLKLILKILVTIENTRGWEVQLD